MKKIITSIIVSCMLLNVLPAITSGEKIIDKSSSINNELLQPFNDGDIFEEFSFVPGEILIKFKDDLNLGFSELSNGITTLGINSIDILSSELGVTSVEKIIKNAIATSSNLYKFTLSKDANVFQAIEEYKKNPLVEIAEPNFVYHSFMVPNDLNFSEQWALHNTGQTGGTPDVDIDAPEAWDIETGSPDVIIAVIDGGIDYNHPDLADNVWVNDGEIPDNGIDDDGNGYIDDIRGWDFVNNDNDPLDSDSHGNQ